MQQKIDFSQYHHTITSDLGQNLQASVEYRVAPAGGRIRAVARLCLPRSYLHRSLQASRPCLPRAGGYLHRSLRSPGVRILGEALTWNWGVDVERSAVAYASTAQEAYEKVQAQIEAAIATLRDVVKAAK